MDLEEWLLHSFSLSSWMCNNWQELEKGGYNYRTYTNTFQLTDQTHGQISSSRVETQDTATGWGQAGRATRGGQDQLLYSSSKVILESKKAVAGFILVQNPIASDMTKLIHVRGKTENKREKWWEYESCVCHVSEELSGCPHVTPLISESLYTRGKEHRPNPGLLQSSDMWFNADGVLLD